MGNCVCLKKQKKEKPRIARRPSQQSPPKRFLSKERVNDFAARLFPSNDYSEQTDQISGSPSKINRSKDTQALLNRGLRANTTEKDEESYRSDQSSDLNPQVKSDRSESRREQFDKSSGSKSHSHSKSHSASNLDKAVLIKSPQQIRRGKVIFRGPRELKCIYQCLHQSTGKLLVAKTYKVSF